MKLFLFLFSVLFMFAACKDEKKKAETTTPEPVPAANADVKGMTTEADEKNRKIDALKKMEPLTLEQLSSFLPAEINGAKKSNYNASSTVGYSYAAADYKKKDKTLQVLFYDLAGEAGSAWFASTYLSSLNVQMENDDQSLRTIDFMGGRAIEQNDKKSNQSTLTYLAGDRVMVVLQGRNMSSDELKEAANSITVKI